MPPAASNLGRLFDARYADALALYGTDRHDESLEMFQWLLLEPRISWTMRCNANLGLAGGLDDWPAREQYLGLTEEAYVGCRAYIAENAPEQLETHPLLPRLRDQIDRCREHLEAERPSDAALREPRPWHEPTQAGPDTSSPESSDSEHGSITSDVLPQMDTLSEARSVQRADGGADILMSDPVTEPQNDDNDDNDDEDEDDGGGTVTHLDSHPPTRDTSQEGVGRREASDG